MQLTQLFQRKADRVNVDYTNDSFQSSFIHAINETLEAMRNYCHVTPNLVVAHDGNTGLDQKYLPVISAGVDYFLHLASEWNIDRPADLDARWESDLRRASTMYYADNPPQGPIGATT